MIIDYYNLSFVIRYVTVPKLRQRLKKIKMFTSKCEILGKKLAVSGKLENFVFIYHVTFRFSGDSQAPRKRDGILKHIKTWMFESCSEI